MTDVEDWVTKPDDCVTRVGDCIEEETCGCFSSNEDCLTELDVCVRLAEEFVTRRNRSRRFLFVQKTVYDASEALGCHL